MSHYLNALTPFALYKSETLRPYFVDKSMLLKQLFPLVREANNYICITRPRRFGKTVMANMIASFFGIGADSGDIFDSLKISRETGYQENRNHFHVIAISFNELPRRCTSYEQYISRIERRLLEDLQRAYPNCGIDPEEAVWDALTRIFSAAGERKFLFVLDEWDFIFHRDFVAEPDKKEYLLFLSNLLKDKPYVSLAYMTGILPVAKYSSGSELNMFLEYTMGGEERFGSFFGFTEAEVDELFLRFQSREKEPQVTREGLRQWYDGYHTGQGERVYNPRSVVTALMNNHMGNYWTSSGPYDEIYYYVRHNIAEVRKDLALMAAGESVPARIRQ